MPRSAVRRRLATVLFLDIVGSTALASELGDARWRELLTRVRRIVREELKRHGGRVQDTAGDGFFATFAEPARALSCAAAIVVTRSCGDRATTRRASWRPRSRAAARRWRRPASGRAPASRRAPETPPR